MFLDATLRRNPQLIDAAIELHRSGRIEPNTFVIDVDQVVENARAVGEAAARHGIVLQVMTKQQGRNPFAALAAVRGGIGGAVAVDLPEARVLQLHGVPIWHLGHLVQVPAVDTAEAIEMKPSVITVFSEEAARRTGEAAIAAGTRQAVLLRVWKPGDFLHPGQEGGFRLDELRAAAERIVRLRGIQVVGVTSFPCLLWNDELRAIRPAGNLESVQEAARILREELGLELSQVNVPGVTCAASIPTIAAAGGTHGEPGSAIAGHTPLHAVSDEPEVPGMVYVSEIASIDRERAYCFGGGFYPRSRLRSGLVATDSDRHVVPAPQLPGDVIDYYGHLDIAGVPAPAVGDTAVFAFRSQVFVGRCQVAAVGGIASGRPEVLGIADQHGNVLGQDHLPLGSAAAAARVSEAWSAYTDAAALVGLR